MIWTVRHSLDRLTIRGFKSIRELEDFELKDLNVFIGGNGAGKSNLIEFFRLLQNIIDGNLNEYIRSGGGISDFLFNGRKVTPQMEFETRFGPRGYRFDIKPGATEEGLLANEARYYQHGTTGWWELGSSPDGKSLLVEEATGNSRDSQCSRPVYEAITSWRIYHFHDTSPTSAMRHYEIVQDNKVLRFDAANIAPYLLRLKNKEADIYREILNAVRLVMPFFDDQSPALIDQFSMEDVIVVNRKDGASTFERLQEEDFKAWLEIYSVGELWSKNVIAGGPIYE